MTTYALYFGLYPMAAMSALIVGSFLIFAVRWFLFDSADKLAGSEEVRERGFFVAYFYALIRPLCRFLAALGVTPNAVTLSSLVIAAAGSWALATGEFMIGAWLMLCASSTDAMDGLLARSLGIESTAGAFLDSFIDRLTEGIFLFAFAWLGGGNLLTFLAIGALISSYAVSYARARGESLGAQGKIGIMQRPVRLTIALLALFALAWGQYFGGQQLEWAMTAATGLIGLLFVGASITATRRARLVYAELVASAEVEALRPAPTENDRNDEMIERAAS